MQDPGLNTEPGHGLSSAQDTSRACPVIQAIESGAADSVRRLHVSPDGKYFAVGTTAGQVRLYEVATGMHVKDICSHETTISSLKWSPDGSCIASSTAKGPVRVWRMATGACNVLKGRQDVVWSPDSSKLSAAVDDYVCGVWNVVTGVLDRCLRCQTDDRHLLHWREDGTLEAIGRYKHGHIRETLWQEGSGIFRKLLRRRFPFERVDMSFDQFIAWNPKSNSVAVKTRRSDEIAVLKVASSRGEEETRRTMDGQTCGVSVAAWSACGRYLAFAANSSVIRVWDCEEWAEVCEFREDERVLHAIAWSPCGGALLYECGKQV